MLKAVIIISGGLDSLCLGAFLKPKYQLFGITFSYGQRASGELKSARHVGKILKLKQHKIVSIDFMKDLYGDTNALTSTQKNLPPRFDYSIVVPLRNAVFLSIASAWAFSLGARLVAYGAHKDDSKYPDCRPAFTKKMQEALNLGEIDGIKKRIRKKIKIWTPFSAGISKSQLLKAGYEEFGNQIYKTWSCYSNSKYHCGRCESCNSRKLAFFNAKIPDKTKYLN